MNALHVWEKYSVSRVWTIKKTNLGTSKPSDCSGSLRRKYVITYDGFFVLSETSYLGGYYSISGQENNAKSIYRAEWSLSSNGGSSITTYYLWTLSDDYTEKREFIEKVTSDNENAYPQNGMQGDYYYAYIGEEYAWTEPKTNWTKNDYIVTETDNAYNRIAGNIGYLKKLADELFAWVADFPVGEEKTHLSLIYAREMNDIENALESLNMSTYSLDIGEKQLFKANGRTPLWSEFNRIESACLMLYTMLTEHKNALPRLALRLGSKLKGLRI